MDHSPDDVLTLFEHFLRDQCISITDLLLLVIKSPLSEHHNTLLPHILEAVAAADDSITNMAAPSPPPLSQFATVMCKTATMVFRKEVARLAEKRNGFHCNATHFKAEAFETLSMERVGAKYRELAPCTVELFSELLDSVPRRRHASAPLSSIRMDVDEEHQEESADPDILGLEEIEASEDPQLQRDLENWLDEEEEGFRATATAEGESVDESPEATASRRRERKSRRMARIRNECLKRIKSVIVLSILMQSSNEHCNMLQTVIGFFLNSVHTPTRVIDLLSHAGISVSASTLLKMDDSLIGQCKDRIIQAWKGFLIGTAYDNLDFTFKTKQPTLENGGRFLSTTSATFLPLEHGVTREDLMCSKYLWDRSINNPNAAASLIYQPGAADFMPPRVPEGGVDLQLARKAWHIRSILVEYCSHFRKYKKDLGVPVPGPIEQRIPPKKTTQIPAELMEVKESTADGNAEVVSSLLRQAGLSPGDTDGMVLLFHGDLSTLERLQAIMFSRGIEDEEWNRFQSVVFIPGLFHAKMAAADALWRIYIKPESPGSPSVTRDAGILRPKEIGKIKATPTFRQLHDTITYSLVARVLDCWRIVAQRVNPEFQDLARFAQSKPGWESIVGLSRSIAEEFVAGHDFARRTQGKPADERDYVRENAMLWLRHALLYTELSHAMNHGDIGRVEEALKSFAFVFDGCGKHKYSVQLSRFLISLNKIYPPRLARAIRMNWLVNPSGKPDGFRAVDWQLELNNLYTKVVHGGSASNHTIGLIRKRSILIELYRGCHVVIERNFSLPFNSTRHSPPDMTKTLAKLCQDLQSARIHIPIAGRGKERDTHKIEDAEVKGMNSLLGKKNTLFPLRHQAGHTEIEDTEMGEETLPLEEVGPQGIEDLGIEE